MKKVKYMLVILLLLLCFQIVSALEIQSYKITATPVNENSVENIIELTIVNDKETELTQGILTMAKDAEIITVSDSYGFLEYSITEETENKKLVFVFQMPVKEKETRVIQLRTKTYNLVQKEGYFEYLLVLVPSKNVGAFTHILRLEKDAELYRSHENVIIVPDANVTETDTNLIIEWKKTLEKDTPAIFLVRFSQETGINYWKWFGIIIIIGGLGAGIGIAGNVLYTKHRQNKALKATNLLNEREKGVLERVIKNPEIKQYELIKQLGYTKSNMSKIIKRLEFRGLVEVKKDGKVRILSLGEKIKKEL